MNIKLKKLYSRNKRHIESLIGHTLRVSYTTLIVVITLNIINLIGII